MADLEAADLAVVNTTDVLKQVRQRLFQLEVGGATGRLVLNHPELQNLHDSRPRIQNQGTAPDSNVFNMAEAESLKDNNEATLGRQ